MAASAWSSSSCSTKSPQSTAVSLGTPNAAIAVAAFSMARAYAM
jgi:hypothetical protein